jgi:hypothetical protein
LARRSKPFHAEVVIVAAWRIGHSISGRSHNEHFARRKAGFAVLRALRLQVMGRNIAEPEIGFKFVDRKMLPFLGLPQ